MQTTKSCVITESSAQTESYAASLASDLRGKVILLKGDLGAGKTTFARGFARGLGIYARVSSPTFTYERIHGTGKNKLYHFDCYRAGTADHLLHHDLAEAMSNQDGTILIEWPYRLTATFPPGSIKIEFKFLSESTRRIKIGAL